LIWAALIGYFAFGEVADVWTWAGAFIIFIATSYIAIRERQTKSKPPESAA